jgi:hypothetical protein
MLDLEKLCYAALVLVLRRQESVRSVVSADCVLKSPYVSVRPTYATCLWHLNMRYYTEASIEQLASCCPTRCATPNEQVGRYAFPWLT